MQKMFLFIEKWLPVALVVSLLLALSSWMGWVGFSTEYLLIRVTVVGLLPFVVGMIQDLLKKNFGVDVIAVTGIVAGVLIGEYEASALILLMLSGGELLENYAIRVARKEVSDLVNNAPQLAHLQDGEILRDVSVDEVEVGSIVMVKPNEVIPLDGVVTEGVSNVDESTLTGESLPVAKKMHSRVYGGTVNKDGVLHIQTTVTSDQTKYAHIIALIREAEEHKAPFVRMADRYSVLFTAVTFTIAGFAWWWSGEVARALAVLVVATPCPLILATPAAFAAGISQAARKGIIVKDAGAIEKLAQVRTMLFDKTGTVTLGVPMIHTVNVLDGDKETWLRYAMSLEQFSVHVLAKAFRAYEGNVGELQNVVGYEEVLGKGVKGKIDGHEVLLGSLGLMEVMGVAVHEELKMHQEELKSEGVMVVYLASDGELKAVFEIEDTIRSDVQEFFGTLKKWVSQVVLVTGDRRSVAENVAARVGIEKVEAECLPEDKVEIVKKYQKEGGMVVMVGDGVNDAPALATANVGIAIGGAESTAATQAGDMVVMSSGLGIIEDAIVVSRRVITIAKQSIWVGIGLSVGLMIVSSFGYIKPVYGAFAQEVIDVIVILNALRARWS